MSFCSFDSCDWTAIPSVSTSTLAFSSHRLRVASSHGISETMATDPSRNGSITDTPRKAIGDAVKSVSDAAGAAIEAVSDAVPEATPLAPSLDTTALGNSLKDAATYSSETLEASLPRDRQAPERPERHRRHGGVEGCGPSSDPAKGQTSKETSSRMERDAHLLE